MVQALLSRDGTAIAYERTGRGPALVVVNGALSDRTSTRQLAPFLDSSFTVYAYDRRGRGSSTDADEYSVDREIEDLDGLLEIIGEPVFLYGHSSGAMLALEATLRGLEVQRLALYEPPFILPGTRPLPPCDLPERLETLVAEGDRDGAVSTFYREAVGVPDAIIDQFRKGANWAAACSLAHTTVYDALVAGQCQLPLRRLAIETPTLVLSGGASPRWMLESNEVLADAMPRSQLVVLEGQGHAGPHQRVASELSRFFGLGMLVGATA